MDSSKDIKDRYASEAETYRKDALLINFDAERLFNEFKIILKKLFNNNNNISELNILDIGAGNGMLTEIVLEVFPNANITMLDFSPEMLDSAKAIFEKNNISLDKIRFSIKDFITDDFPNEKYDLIVSSYALHHIRRKDELETVYKKIANALKIGGTFICLDNYLETNDDLRNNQVKVALEKWTENYQSKEIANEWASILKGEDSPATIPLIISAMNKNKKITPFIIKKNGVLATIYGMTTLSHNRIDEMELDSLVDETKKYRGKEEKIDSYPFN